MRIRNVLPVRTDYKYRRWLTNEVESFISEAKVNGSSDEEMKIINTSMYIVQELIHVLQDNNSALYDTTLVLKTFERLLNDLPLTELWGTEDSWNLLNDKSDSDTSDMIAYDHKRYSGLGKVVDTASNTASYYDITRAETVDMNGKKVPNALASYALTIHDLIDPIKFPYMPLSDPIKILVEQKTDDATNVRYAKINTIVYPDRILDIGGLHVKEDVDGQYVYIEPEIYENIVHPRDDELYVEKEDN